MKECEICKKELDKNKKRFCSIPCRSMGNSILNKKNNHKPPSRLGLKMSEEYCQKQRLFLLSRTNPMKNPETVRKLQEAKKRTYDLKGRKSKLRDLIKSTFQYKNWRTSVFIKDNFSCVWCNKKGYVQADHIKPYSMIIKQYNIKSVCDAEKCSELWDINNGRTLCKECHRKTDTYGNRVKKLLV